MFILAKVVKLGIDTTSDRMLFNNSFIPFARLEYALEMMPETNAYMRYVNDTTQYGLTTRGRNLSQLTARIGGNYNHEKGVSSSAFYERTESHNYGHANTFHFKATFLF